jgi:hypothetical protein
MARRQQSLPFSLLAVRTRTKQAALLTPQARNGLYAVGIATVNGFGALTLLMYVHLVSVTHRLEARCIHGSIYLAHALRYAAMLRAANVMTKRQTKSCPTQP